MNAPPTNDEIIPRFESFEEQILRAFPLLRHAILSSNPDQPDADDGSTAVRLPPPIALSPSAEAFTCRICLELASRPVVSVCNEQCMYCFNCFERYLEMRPASARDRCCVICLDVPVSRGRLYEDILATNPMVSRIYRGIEVACPKDGCDWKGQLDQYRRHGANCLRQTVLESLRDKLVRTVAELEQTRNVRDEALVERDEARNERDKLLTAAQMAVDSLRDKLDQMQAELDQTRNKRDEALEERDEARNERDELGACLVDIADDITTEASNLANNSRRRTAREILLSLYADVQPEKVGMIDGILEKYAGRENELYNNLVAKFGLGTLQTHGYCPPFDDPLSGALTSAISSHREALAKGAAELVKIRAELDQTRAERDELSETIQRMQEESKEKEDDGDDGDEDNGDDEDGIDSTATWEM